MFRGVFNRDGGIMPLRSSQLIGASVFVCLLLWLTFGTEKLRSPNSASTKGTASLPESSDELPPPSISSGSHLNGHDGIVNLTDPSIGMAKIHIAVSQTDVPQLPIMQLLDIELPPLTQITVTDDLSDPNVQQAVPVSTKIQVPRVPLAHPDASTFLFGVATTYERLESSLDSFAHWLGGSNARLIATLAPSLDPEAPGRVLKKAAALNVPLGTVESSLEFLDRYFSMLRVLHENRTPETKWYVFIDDDTFFLDLQKLISTFDKMYDPMDPWYIGSLSEDFQQMARWGYMAYGGGGIFLSAPLIEQLLPHYDACFRHRNTGDRMLAECIYQHTTTKFTWQHNLHQLDLHGDHSGFYEALRPQPLSVHHWKSENFEFQHDMHNLSLVARICGNACLLQKFRLKDDWVLTNGFSLVKYSNADTRYRDIGTDVSMERTWNFIYGGTSNVQFEYSLGPIRKPDEGEKETYRMESAIVEEDGRVRQLYVKRRRRVEIIDEMEVETVNKEEVEAVVEIIWSTVPGAAI